LVPDPYCIRPNQRAFSSLGQMALCLALNLNYVVTGQPLVERLTRLLPSKLINSLFEHFFKLNHVPTSFSIWIECFVKHKSQHDYLCGSLISVFEVLGFYGSPRSFRIALWRMYLHHILKGMSLILLIQLLLEALDQASLSLARTV
jgi:hypothetical protein